MAAGNTYTPIATTTISSNTTSYNFTSISGSYTDLVLVLSVISTSTNPNYIYLQYNGDTATNYSTTILSGTGTSAVSGRFATRANFNLDYNATPTTTPTTRIIQIMNYSNTTTYKTGIDRASSAAGGVDLIVGLWRSTAAITSILVTHDTAQFAAGTMMTLYGILAA